MKSSLPNLRLILLTFFLSISSQSYAQWMLINQNGGYPDSTAALEIESNDRGLLIPRMTQSERNAINGAAQGLLIYQTDQDTGFYFFRGNSWVNVAQSLDNDADDTNELQTLSIDGDSLSISNGNKVFLGSSNNSIVRDTFYLPDGYTAGSVTLPHSLGRMPTEIYRNAGSGLELLAIYTDQLETITSVSNIFFSNNGSGGSSAQLTFTGISSMTDSTITLIISAVCKNINGGSTSCASSGLANWTSSEIIAILYLK